MNDFWILVDANGRVLQGLDIPVGIIPAENNQGTFVKLDQKYSPKSIAYFDDEVVEIGTAPDANHVYDYVARAWVDPRTLADFKALKWGEIKAKRTELEFGTFTYNGMVFDGDLDAQRRLAAYVSVSKSAIAAEQPFSAEFILADNSVVTLTAEDFVGIELAKVAAVAAAFAQAVIYRNQIEAATTLSELESIVWV